MDQSVHRRVCKALEHFIRSCRRKLAGMGRLERSTAEFRHLSGRGHSRGWSFNRDEIHERG